ncbi:unnamed protein product [Brassica rapa]|uniref:Uncharacterized protein n=1 Tax=Brassica campestris TaxID=3711 RepID=A0A8D9HJY4_BRACM|nr:unnamed protein product [Brassica rapa]
MLRFHRCTLHALLISRFAHSQILLIILLDGYDEGFLFRSQATMMPVTVNVNRFATHMPNTSPALTYAACYNTSWILRFWNVDAAWNNVLLAVPALLYAIENYIRFTPPPPRLLSLKGMSRWLKIAMDVASAAILAVAQCMEAAEVSRAERAFGLCCQRCHQCSFCRRYLTLTAGEPQV